MNDDILNVAVHFSTGLFYKGRRNTHLWKYYSTLLKMLILLYVLLYKAIYFNRTNGESERDKYISKQ